MTTAWGTKFCFEYAACVYLTFGTIFLLITFSMAIEFLIGLMTISFALTVDLYKSLGISENGQLKRILFQKILNY